MCSCVNAAATGRDRGSKTPRLRSTREGHLEETCKDESGSRTWGAVSVLQPMPAPEYRVGVSSGISYGYVSTKPFSVQAFASFALGMNLKTLWIVTAGTW